MTVEVVLENKARCGECGDVVESRWRHDYRSCRCGNLHVDGGLDYIKRGYRTPNYEELSKTTTKEVEDTLV